MKQFLFLLFCFAVSGLPARGQEAWRRGFQFTYQNDYFSATDQYFTQGIRLELAAPWLRRSPLAPVLLRFAKDPRLIHYFFIAQDGYTPTSIRADSILRQDRPYSGALYLGQRAISIQHDRARKLSTEIRLGVLGPWALVGEEQTFIHQKTGNVLPMGWQFQIRNDLLLNYQVQFDKQLYSSRWLNFEGGGHGWLGTYRTRLGVQARAALGWIINDYDPDKQAAKTRLFFFASGSLSAIGYDAGLQGGLLNRSSVYTIRGGDIRRLVGSVMLGLECHLGKLHLAFSHTYLQREFRGGLPHAWGTVQIGRHL